MAERKPPQHAEAVDWQQYFQGIRSECPWSLKAYLNNQLEIVPYSDLTLVDNRKRVASGEPEAVIYTFYTNISSKWLEEMCDKLNDHDPRCEYLWSHPEHGGSSTPLPVLIQQQKVRLTKLRLKLGYSDEEE